MSESASPLEIDLAGDIQATGTAAADIRTRLKDAYVDVQAQSSLYSESSRARILGCSEAYNALLGEVKSMATDLRVNALEQFGPVADYLGKVSDNELAVNFEYITSQFPAQSKPVETSDGKTFGTVEHELKDIASAIVKDSEDKLAKANAKVTQTEIKLGRAEEALRQAKLLYKSKIPLWLKAVGLGENSSKEYFMLVTAPLLFIAYITPLGHLTPIAEIKKLHADIAVKEKAVVAARADLVKAFDEVAAQEDAGDKIRRTTSDLNSLSTDLLGVGPKLEVFDKVYDMVKSDINIFVRVLRDGHSEDGKMTRENLPKQVKESEELYKGIAIGLTRIELEI